MKSYRQMIPGQAPLVCENAIFEAPFAIAHRNINVSKISLFMYIFYIAESGLVADRKKSLYLHSPIETYSFG